MLRTIAQNVLRPLGLTRVGYESSRRLASAVAAAAEAGGDAERERVRILLIQRLMVCWSTPDALNKRSRALVAGRSSALHVW